jgi:excisionase family DNA binding protein
MMNQQSEVSMPDPKQVPADKIPSLLTQLSAFQTALAARLLQNPNEAGTASADRLLKIGEAAQKLRTSKDWLYRNYSNLPFTRRIGRSIRFSERALDHFIEQLSISA